MSILKIAVTGSVGSGKSFVCRYFERLGFAVMDCDRIARDVVEPGEKGFDAVVDLFGPSVVLKEGGLDRKKLRELIIRQSDLREKMEGILHPLILDEMQARMAEAEKKGFKAVAAEVPLLFETGMDRYFDMTVAVLAEDEALVQRISTRDGVCEDSARGILDLQMPQKKKEQLADYVVKNTGTESELFDSVANLYKKIEKEFLTT